MESGPWSSCSVYGVKASGRGSSASSDRAESKSREGDQTYLWVPGFVISSYLSLSICVMSGELPNPAGP